jgi:mannose-6-phosphate isomerase-like protein (cupin superfamily)
MKRSFTADHPFIKYEAASATLTFDATTPPAPGLEVFDTRFQFGPNAAFDSFLHFHIDHAEFLYCERGRIRVTIGHETRVVGPEDGEISIPKWVPHRWETLQIDEETVVWERTDPADGEKELFFRCAGPRFYS